MSWKRLFAIVFLSCLLVGSVWAQNSTPQQPEAAQQASSAQSAEPNNSSPQAEPSDPNGGVSRILAEASEKAASTSEKWGRRLGLGHDASFAISLFFNFGAIVVLFYLLIKSQLLRAFRDRTGAIQTGIREARAASAEASQRLSDIEARLAKMDKEVEKIRASAEQEAAAEEQRIRAAAEEDKRKVVQGAETEIHAIARNARQELKKYAASLSVDLAEKRIRVDESADQTLVREFVHHLGKDGE